jgi:Rrf2 family iron-sulfur cluster assembly transcriptional regulator
MTGKLKLTKQRKNAVAMMAEIAHQGGETPVSLSAVAGATGFSVAYLEILAGDLRRGGLIRGFRGPGGGYILAKPAADISILDIVRSTKEAMALKSKEDRDSMPFSVRRGRDLWDQLEICHYLLLQHISLADVLNGTSETHPLLKRIRDVLRESSTHSRAAGAR